jgi:hypothetical protein
MSKFVSSYSLSTPVTSSFPVDLFAFPLNKHEKGIYLAKLYKNVFLDDAVTVCTPHIEAYSSL